MTLDTKTSKRVLVLVAISLGMVWVMLRLELLPQFVGRFFSFFGPLWVGVFIAFVVNLPMRFLERTVFGGPWAKGEGLRLKIKRPLSMLLAFLIIAGGLTAVVFMVLPDITNTIISFTQQLPQTIREVQLRLESLSDSNSPLMDFLQGSNLSINDLVQRFINWLNNTMSVIASSAFGWITGLINGFLNMFLGFVFAIYFLLQKERIGRQVKQVAYAVLPVSFVDKVAKLGQLVNTVFSRFISGQGLEACILGTLVFLGMQIFRFPYPLTISVLVILGALIPIFGAFVAGMLGASLILVRSPAQALWFIVMLIVIQGIEGNFIYPRVVGKTVGLPSIWVLFAVTFGSKLFGFLGLLLGVPAFSVIYILMRSWSSYRVEEKAVNPLKLRFQTYTANADLDYKDLEQAEEEKTPWILNDEADLGGLLGDEKAEPEVTPEPQPQPSPKVRKFTAHFDLAKVERELADEAEEARRIREEAWHKNRKRKS